MPQYRHVLVDRKTGSPTVQTRLGDVTYDEALTGIGTCAGSVPLDEPTATESNFRPGARELAIMRDNAVAWCGPIVNTTASMSGGKASVAVEARTPDWWLSKRIVKITETWTGDLFDVVRRLVAYGLDQDPVPGVECSSNLAGVQTVLELDAADGQTVLRVLQDLAQREDSGFEYRWAFSIDKTANRVVRRMMLGAPRVGVRSEHRPVVNGPWLLALTVPRDLDAGSNAVFAIGSPPKPIDLGEQTFEQAVAAAKASQEVAGSDAFADALAAEKSGVELKIDRTPRMWVGGDPASVDLFGLVESTVNFADTPREQLRRSALQHLARTKPLLAQWQFTYRPSAAMPHDAYPVGTEIENRAGTGLLALPGWHRVESRSVTITRDGEEKITVTCERETPGQAGGSSRRYSPAAEQSRVARDGEKTLRAATRLADNLSGTLTALSETSLQTGRDTYTADAAGEIEIVFSKAFPASKTVVVTAVAHADASPGPWVIELVEETSTGFTARLADTTGVLAPDGTQVVVSWHAASLGTGTTGGADRAPDPGPDPDAGFGTLVQPAGGTLFDDRFLGYQVGSQVGLPYRLFNVGYSDNLPGNALVQEDANDGARSILGEYGHRVDLTGGPAYRGTIAVDMSPVGPYDDLPAMDPGAGGYWNYPTVIAGLCQAPGSNGLYVWNELAATSGGTFVQLPGSGVRTYWVPAGGVQYGHMRISAGKTRLLITVEDSATPGMCSLSSRIVTSAGDVLQHVGPAGETHRDVPDTLRYLQLTSDLKPWRAWRVQATNYTGPDGLPPAP